MLRKYTVLKCRFDLTPYHVYLPVPTLYICLHLQILQIPQVWWWLKRSADRGKMPVRCWRLHSFPLPPSHQANPTSSLSSPAPVSSTSESPLSSHYTVRKAAQSLIKASWPEEKKEARKEQENTWNLSPFVAVEGLACRTPGSYSKHFLLLIFVLFLHADWTACARMHPSVHYR